MDGWDKTDGWLVGMVSEDTCMHECIHACRYLQTPVSCLLAQVFRPSLAMVLVKVSTK